MEDFLISRSDSRYQSRQFKSTSTKATLSSIKRQFHSLYQRNVSTKHLKSSIEETTSEVSRTAKKICESGNYQEAILFLLNYQKLISIWGFLPLENEKLEISNCLSLIYRKEGSFEKAFQLTEKDLPLLKSSKIKPELKSSVLLNYTAMLSEVSRTQEAINHAQKALNILEKLYFKGNLRNEAEEILVIAYFDIGSLYETLNNLALSIRAYSKAYKFFKEFNINNRELRSEIKEAIKKIKNNMQPNNTFSTLRPFSAPKPQSNLPRLGDDRRTTKRVRGNKRIQSRPTSSYANLRTDSWRPGTIVNVNRTMIKPRGVDVPQLDFETEFLAHKNESSGIFIKNEEEDFEMIYQYEEPSRHEVSRRNALPELTKRNPPIEEIKENSKNFENFPKSRTEELPKRDSSNSKRIEIISNLDKESHSNSILKSKEEIFSNTEVIFKSEEEKSSTKQDTHVQSQDKLSQKTKILHRTGIKLDHKFYVVTVGVIDELCIIKANADKEFILKIPSHVLSSVTPQQIASNISIVSDQLVLPDDMLIMNDVIEPVKEWKIIFKTDKMINQEKHLIEILVKIDRSQCILKVTGQNEYSKEIEVFYEDQEIIDDFMFNIHPYLSIRDSQIVLENKNTLKETIERGFVQGKDGIYFIFVLKEQSQDSSLAGAYRGGINIKIQAFNLTSQMDPLIKIYTHSEALGLTNGSSFMSHIDISDELSLSAQPRQDLLRSELVYTSSVGIEFFTIAGDDENVIVHANLYKFLYVSKTVLKDYFKSSFSLSKMYLEQITRYLVFNDSHYLELKKPTAPLKNQPLFSSSLKKVANDYEQKVILVQRNIRKYLAIRYFKLLRNKKFRVRKNRLLLRTARIINKIYYTISLYQNEEEVLAQLKQIDAEIYFELSINPREIFGFIKKKDYSMVINSIVDIEGRLGYIRTVGNLADVRNSRKEIVFFERTYPSSKSAVTSKRIQPSLYRIKSNITRPGISDRN